MKQYQPRPIRFLETYLTNNFTIKLYSISDNQEFVSNEYTMNAKKYIHSWLFKKQLTTLSTYNIATLILHEGKEGCFAILNWWIDDNMLQHYVYLAKGIHEPFEEYSSNNGIITCVWEMAVLWHERNAWIEHVLTPTVPNFEAYINHQLNQD